MLTSANRDSESRLSSLALDRRASRLRLAASALIVRASHAPARCWSTHSCTSPLCPRPATGSACSARTAPSARVAVRGALGGGVCVPLGAPFPLAGGGFVLLDVNDVSHPHLPLPPHMDAHGKPCHVRPLRPPLPCPIVVRLGANLPAGQELMGMFAYRLVRGHWRVQTRVSRIGEEGTVTTGGVCLVNVLTG